MPNQEKLEAVRKKIIEANDDIMKLKFGTKVILSHRVTKKYPGGGREYNYISKNENYYTFLSFGGLFSIRPKKEVKILKILGRPIGIADVLIACKKNRKVLFVKDTGILTDPDTLEVLADQWDAVFEKAGVENELEYFWYNWNFYDDNLDNQKPEVWEFLFNLLCK